MSFPTLQIPTTEMPGMLRRGKIGRELREAIAASTEMEIHVIDISFEWIPEKPRQDRTPYVMINYIPLPTPGMIVPLVVKAHDVIVAALESIAPGLAANKK